MRRSTASASAWARAELYRAVEAVPEVVDTLVVDLEYLGRESYMPLFVVLRAGVTLDDALRERSTAAIRTALSPQPRPERDRRMPEVPRTLSGKKMEVPIKRLLLGEPLDEWSTRRDGESREPRLVRALC